MKGLYTQRRRAIREAHDADKEVTYNGEKVYADGKLIYTPDVPEPEEIEVDKKARLWMYEQALETLATENRKFSSNYNMWVRWDAAMRLWWVDNIEAQAKAGKQTIGAEVVARAVEIRLTRTMP